MTTEVGQWFKNKFFLYFFRQINLVGVAAGNKNKLLIVAISKQRNEGYNIEIASDNSIKECSPP